jgi:hypothetical protein
MGQAKAAIELFVADLGAGTVAPRENTENTGSNPTVGTTSAGLIVLLQLREQILVMLRHRDAAHRNRNRAPSDVHRLDADRLCPKISTMSSAMKSAQGR